MGNRSLPVGWVASEAFGWTSPTPSRKWKTSIPGQSTSGWRKDLKSLIEELASPIEESKVKQRSATDTGFGFCSSFCTFLVFLCCTMFHACSTCSFCYFVSVQGISRAQIHQFCWCSHSQVFALHVFAPSLPFSNLGTLWLFEVAFKCSRNMMRPLPIPLARHLQRHPHQLCRPNLRPLQSPWHLVRWLFNLNSFW